VGALFCVGVIGMYHSGIGGGGFMIVRSSNNSYEFIDFRETAPAAAYQDMYNNNTLLSLFGGLARYGVYDTIKASTHAYIFPSGVPGELRGLEHLHKNYGKLSWSLIMQPAIAVARYGFTVTQDLVNQMDAATTGHYNFLVNNPTWAIDFAPNGTRVALGQTMTRKRYADTLEVIAQQGADAFYTGAIANATITALKAAGGTMTLADLKNYAVAIRKPAQITYRGFKVTSCSAPSSGVVAMSVMKAVEGYQDFGYASTLNLSTHRFDEAIRFGYGEVRCLVLLFTFSQFDKSTNGLLILYVAFGWSLL